MNGQGSSTGLDNLTEFHRQEFETLWNESRAHHSVFHHQRHLAPVEADVEADGEADGEACDQEDLYDTGFNPDTEGGDADDEDDNSEERSRSSTRRKEFIWHGKDYVLQEFMPELKDEKSEMDALKA
jgi:hypothetical protein